MDRKASISYLPDCKFIFKGTSPYGEVIFVNKTNKVMSLYALLDIKDTYILSYNDDKFVWIPIYIYNKESKTFSCEKNARFYYDFNTKEISILNNKFHKLDTLNTESGVDLTKSTDNIIGKLIYFFYYSYYYFDIRYASKQTDMRRLRSRKSLGLIDDFINNVKLQNRFSLKLFVNNLNIDIQKILDTYKDFCYNGIYHDILLNYIFDSLIYLNIDYDCKYSHDSIIFNQLNGIKYDDNFKHFNVFTLNDKKREYKYFRVAVKCDMQLTNLVVYTDNYLLRLIDVRE